MPTTNPLPTDPAAWHRAGRRVVHYRHAHGTRKHGRAQPLTQAALAENAKVSTGCLQAFETGTRATQPENVARIATAIGLTVDELFAPETPTSAYAITFDPASATITLTDEAIAIAYVFSVAYTEIRAAVKTQLLAHLQQRHDRAAVDVVRQLRTKGRIAATAPPNQNTAGGGGGPISRSFPLTR